MPITMYMRPNNSFMIVLSVLLAIVFGRFYPAIFAHIGFFGDIFINLLKAFALPLICSALVVAIGNMGNNIGQLGPLVRNSVGYMLLSEVMAVLIALLLFNLFNPGAHVDSNIIEHTHIDSMNLNLADFVLSIFPHNVFESLFKFDLLPIVVFFIMFGIGCALLPDRQQYRSILDIFTAIRNATQICLCGVMYFAPFGIFVLIGSAIARSLENGNLMSILYALLSFVVILLFGLLLHFLWQFILMIAVTRLSVWRVLVKGLPVLSTAFATSSSIATLPFTVTASEELGASRNVVQFMLPIAAAINLGGMMMYEVAASLFFAQALGIHLTILHQVLIAIACILGGIAAGGIPETSLVSLVVVFKIVNIPLSAISILLPLDRIIDRCRTMVNIFGNMCGVLIVSKFVSRVKS